MRSEVLEESLPTKNKIKTNTCLYKTNKTTFYNVMILSGLFVNDANFNYNAKIN